MIVNAAIICNEKFFVTVTCGLLLSVTRTVKFDVPVAVGVPPIVPDVRVRPAGSEPELIDQL